MAWSNDSDIHQVRGEDDVVNAPDNEKRSPQGEKDSFDHIEAAEDVNAIETAVKEGHTITPEMRKKVAEHYGRKAEEDQIAPSADVTAILERIIAMTDEEAVDVLVQAIEFHKVRLRYARTASARLFCKKKTDRRHRTTPTSRPRPWSR